MGRTKRVRCKKKITISGSDNELLDFMKLNSWKNNNCLKIGNFDKSGRGLYSKNGLKEGESIIELPYHLLISLTSLENDLEFCEVFREFCDLLKYQISSQTILAFYILYQKHIGVRSKWLPYLNSIPEYFTNPFFCSKDELYNLPGSILEKCVSQNEIVKSNFLKIKSVFNDKICICCSLPYFDEIFNLDNFKWAFFAVNSRSVFIDTKILKTTLKSDLFLSVLNDEPNMALAPFLDLLNHSNNADITQNIYKNSENQLIYQIITNKKFKKKKEIFIKYGEHSNTKLLLEYGFFIPNRNSDFFEIHLLDIENTIKSDSTLRNLKYPKNIFKYINDHNLDKQMFFNQSDFCSHNLLIVLTLIFIKSGQSFNEIAFGKIIELNENLIKLIHKLLNFKITELNCFLINLNKLSELSESGKVFINYLKECINLLNKINEMNRV